MAKCLAALPLVAPTVSESARNMNGKRPVTTSSFLWV